MREKRNSCCWSGRLQIAERIAAPVAESGCGQGASEYRAGIEIEAVAAKIRQAVALRRVAVDDQAPMVPRVRQKRLSDPNKIVVALRTERLVGVNAGMNEKTLPVVVAKRKRPQPGDMRRRKVARVVDMVTL